MFAHKVVLAAVSDYFRAMFSNKMEESLLHSVYLQDLDEKAVACLVDYAYTGLFIISNRTFHENLSVIFAIRTKKCNEVGPNSSQYADPGILLVMLNTYILLTKHGTVTNKVEK